MLIVINSEQGEVVIDLGSGAGFDVFLAANKVGPEGKAVGVDMNKVRIFVPLILRCQNMKDVYKRPGHA